MVTHQLQVERRTGKVRQSETDVLPTVLRHQPHTAWQQANSRGRALQRPRIVNDWQPIIRRGIRSGLCDPDHMSLEDLVTDADDKLFNLILYSKHHVLHRILLDRSNLNYNLRPRRHNLVLTAKS